jgi:hypothetical protein
MDDANVPSTQLDRARCIQVYSSLTRGQHGGEFFFFIALFLSIFESSINLELIALSRKLVSRSISRCISDFLYLIIKEIRFFVTNFTNFHQEMLLESKK